MWDNFATGLKMVVSTKRIVPSPRYAQGIKKMKKFLLPIVLILSLLFSALLAALPQILAQSAGCGLSHKCTNTPSLGCGNTGGVTRNPPKQNNQWWLRQHPPSRQNQLLLRWNSQPRCILIHLKIAFFEWGEYAAGSYSACEYRSRQHPQRYSIVDQPGHAAIEIKNL